MWGVGRVFGGGKGGWRWGGMRVGGGWGEIEGWEMRGKGVEDEDGGVW